MEQSLGQRLRAARERKKLTQQAVAKAAGITVSAVSQIESGQKSPRLSTLGRLAAAVGVVPGDLVSQRRKATGA